MSDKFEFIGREIERLEKENLMREERIFTSAQTPHAIIDGKEMILLSSSNYLSLSENKDIFEKTIELIKDYGMGSGGSRLTTGSSKLHIDLEKLISTYLNYEDSILYSSGFMANLGVFALCDEDTVIFSDELNHASIIEGIRKTKSQLQIYKHLDYEDLEKKLNTSDKKKKFIVSDGVFSMDGDILDLCKFVSLGEKYEALTYVDDAHGFGVLGKGRGITGKYDKKPDILLSTFSKALGASGAVISSNKEIIKYLKNKSREYIFSTSLSPFDIAASIISVNKLIENFYITEKLLENVEYIKNGLSKLELRYRDKSHIIPIYIGDEYKAGKVFLYLYSKNIFISFIRYPAVKKGSAILRITPMANHSKEDLDYFLKEMEIAKEKFNI